MSMENDLMQLIAAASADFRREFVACGHGSSDDAAGYSVRHKAVHHEERGYSGSLNWRENNGNPSFTGVSYLRHVE